MTYQELINDSIDIVRVTAGYEPAVMEGLAMLVAEYCLGSGMDVMDFDFALFFLSLESPLV